MTILSISTAAGFITQNTIRSADSRFCASREQGMTPPPATHDTQPDMIRFWFGSKKDAGAASKEKFDLASSISASGKPEVYQKQPTQE
jgi:hypothetical protein